MANNLNNISNKLQMNLQLFATKIGRFDETGTDISGCLSWDDYPLDEDNVALGIANTSGMTDHFIRIPVYADIEGLGNEKVENLFIPGIKETGTARGDKDSYPIIRGRYEPVEHDLMGHTIVDKLLSYGMEPQKALYYDNCCKAAITLKNGEKEFLGENFSIIIVVCNSFDGTQKFALHCVPVNSNGDAFMLACKTSQHYIFKHTKQVTVLVPEVGRAISQFEAYLEELNTKLTKYAYIPLDRMSIEMAIDAIFPMALVPSKGGDKNSSLNEELKKCLMKDYGTQAEGTALKLVYMANDVANHHFIRQPKDIDHQFLMAIAGCKGTPEVVQNVMHYIDVNLAP